MSSSLQVDKRFLPDSTWEATVTVLDGGTLPKDIFIYLNSGTAALGSYVGICSLEEYQKFQTFSGVSIPKFGNKYVKASQAKIKVSSETEIDTAISQIVSSVKALSLALSSGAQTTTVIDIP